MEYTTAIIKETLRMATPVATSFKRIAKTDLRLGDLKIKKRN
jgi:cytochrome P450